MSSIYAWSEMPSLNELVQFCQRNPHRKNMVFCLTTNQIPIQILPQNPSNDLKKMHTIWQEATQCLVFDAVNFIADALPQTDWWFFPTHMANHLAEHFGVSENIIWQTPSIPQHPSITLKSWQMPPQNFRLPETPRILIIGAGIAGASTAYECAIRGAHVTVLEANPKIAQAGSGNRQGLLYAKISPHNTPQTELLLTGYGYTRRLLSRLLPEQKTWNACGVLHLNYNENETCRNQKLAKNTHYAHLYRAINADEASKLAGISIEQDGLFWQQGAWINPPSIVQKLLQHEHIEVKTNCAITNAQYHNNQWIVQTNTGEFSGSHVVFCVGANNQHVPIVRDFPFQMIRGQTSLIQATETSQQLKIALSGASYISPAWHQQHCFGATFVPNDTDNAWRESEDYLNVEKLQQLNADLAVNLDFSGSLKGHSAIRCDCYDHLPAVGALGNVALMREVYAKFALDKNYYINTPCPYLPNAFINTAHGSRGLATAPICGAEIAAIICDTPRPLSERLRQALNPNRLIIHQIVYKNKGLS